MTSKNFISFLVASQSANPTGLASKGTSNRAINPTPTKPHKRSVSEHSSGFAPIVC
ncbi:hypothetical protein JT221_07470 [Helicobacter pylori]|nr:hypothetical protein [Helicobacter pylori]